MKDPRRRDGLSNETALTLLGDGLDDTALALARAGFAALWDGRAANPSDLVPAAGDRAEEAARRLARRGRAEIDEAGAVVGIHGLTLGATRHRIDHDGRSHQTWCAFDAIGIPAALGIDALAATDCPSCHATIRVLISDGEPASGHSVLWLPTSPGAHLMAEFCASADLYCDRDHLADVVGAERAGEIVSLAEASALGRETWADVADILSPA